MDTKGSRRIKGSSQMNWMRNKGQKNVIETWSGKWLQEPGKGVVIVSRRGQVESQASGPRMVGTITPGVFFFWNHSSLEARGN